MLLSAVFASSLQMPAMPCQMPADRLSKTAGLDQATRLGTTSSKYQCIESSGPTIYQPELLETREYTSHQSYIFQVHRVISGVGIGMQLSRLSVGNEASLSASWRGRSLTVPGRPALDQHDLYVHSQHGRRPRKDGDAFYLSKKKSQITTRKFVVVFSSE
jgi:hypothetical protein